MALRTRPLALAMNLLQLMQKWRIGMFHYKLGHFRICRDVHFQSGSLDISAAFSCRYWLELYSIGMVTIGLVARSQKISTRS